ncbi:PAS domain-containing sensor histidine kinase [Ramlibacter sp.]|uniref:PAS domain-containing sensor histidine kinase n=1 Tax=Ramlibacter sp. TaxID=1917967 RepID=UPI002FCC6ED6
MDHPTDAQVPILVLTMERIQRTWSLPDDCEIGVGFRAGACGAGLYDSERMRGMLEASPCGMIVVDAQGRIEVVNREAERQFGYTRQELVGMEIDDLLPESERRAHARLRDGYHAAPCHRPMGAERELQGRRKDGSVFPVQVGLNPLQGTSRGLVLASVLDITERLEAQRVVREAARRKDEFIAVLAHELRNPLAPVRNALEILKRTTAGDAQLARLRDIMDRQVSHMTRLVDDLLDVSRIGRGQLTLRAERCDFAAIVRQTAEDYRSGLEADGQRLVLHGCDGPLWVDGDPVRLAQMLGNLLANAGRFRQGPGTVEIRARVDPAAGLVRLSVADTGIGMDGQLLERLFNPFSQAPQDLARTQGGLGLGLAVTKGMAELHGGSVRAESEGPGRGACFTITLPLAPAD